MEAAENAVLNEDYYSALEYYGEALEFDETNLEVQYKYAEAAKNFHAYTLAEQEFQRTLDLDSTFQFPLTTYHLAEVQQQLGKYQDAKRNYELFLSEYTGKDESLMTSSRNEIEACNWAIDQEDVLGVNAEVERLNNNINTGYSEFGALSHEDELYYSSLRFENQNGEFDPARSFAKILKSLDGDAAGEVIENGAINDTRLHVAHTSIPENNAYIFYTICEYDNAYDIRCDLYYRPIDDNGMYGEAMPLPNYINGREFTSTQPHASINKETGEIELYYSSNRRLEGGVERGLDIWKTTMREDGTFTQPENVQRVNTAGDEITPFFHQGSQTLYFSSNAGFRFGGYDIFKSNKSEGAFQERVNLGKEINTSFNDVYYNLSKNGQEAYFSSNRIGSLYLDELAEACCYDIYKASIESTVIKLNALTFIEKNMAPLDGATVELYDALSGELLGEITVNDSNEHLFDIESGREYKLVAKKQGYENDTILFNTYDTKDSLITKKLFLESKCIELDLTTFEQLTGKDLTGVEIVIEDLTYPGGRIQRSNMNGNDFNFCLEKDREYKITANKYGYESSSILVDTRNNLPNNRIERKIYLSKKLDDLATMLPVVLYFDNDEPDKNTYRLYTSRTYTDTYYPYIARKDEFKTRYSAPLSAAYKESAAANIESFFEGDVKGGYTKMQKFLASLLNRLGSGERFELQIKGYTSPRASNQYNLALGQRRVFALKNELRSYMGGALSSHLDNGSLKVKDVSYGEELAPSSVSDSYEDRRASIYSVEASKERRATIVDLIKLN